MTSSGGFWSQWWRLGGILGIAFIVLFIIGGLVLKFDSPGFDDPIKEARSYFVDDGTKHLVGNYLVGIASVLLFLPFLMTLRSIHGWVEGGPNILSWLAFIGGLSMALLGTATLVSEGALALGAAADAEVADSSVRALMYDHAYRFSGLYLAIALFLFAASAVIFRTGVFWRWLALLGLAAGVLCVIGAAWPSMARVTALWTSLGSSVFLASYSGSSWSGSACS